MTAADRSAESAEVEWHVIRIATLEHALAEVRRELKMVRCWGWSDFFGGLPRLSISCPPHFTENDKSAASGDSSHRKINQNQPQEENK